MDEEGPSGPSATALPAPNFGNLAYATRSSSQRLDIYLPKTGSGPFPLVIWIHGGGWRTGDRSFTSHPEVLNILGQGLAIASIDYRLSGEAKFPAQIHDVKAAIRFLRANATRYKLDANRFGAWGPSAGGHLAALAGTSGGVSGLTDLSLGNPTQSDRLSAVVDWFGPVSFLQMDPQLKTVGCPLYAGVGHVHPSSPPSLLVGGAITKFPGKVTKADPITFVDASDPAMMIQHGTADCAVPYLQSTGLRNALQQKLPASRITYQVFNGYKHGDSRFYSTANITAVGNFFKSKL